MGWVLVVAPYMRSFILMGVMVILLLVPKMVFFLAEAAITRVITGRLAGEKALLDI